MVGQQNCFNLFKYFICNFGYCIIFSTFFSVFDYILLRFHNNMFGVGVKT